jgi:hypothetical protein
MTIKILVLGWKFRFWGGDKPFIVARDDIIPRILKLFQPISANHTPLKYLFWSGILVGWRVEMP